MQSYISSDWGFTKFVQAAQQEGFLHAIPVIHGLTGATLRLGEKELINFAGINFLGFQQDPDFLTSFAEASKSLGLATGGSRLTQGVSLAHRKVEEELCAITGKERAITFASGLLANFGFIHAMSSRFSKNAHCHIDNTDAIFVLDRDIHWSLRKATERFSPGKQRFYFQHNDPAHLREILAERTGAKVVVVFESVYSSDGSIAPIGELLDVCERYGAVSFVDDANGFFVYGQQQRPFAQEFSHLHRATFVMVSFSKAIGLEGGAIAGPADPIDAFELLSGTTIFTAAIQPPTASAIYQMMRTLQEHPEIMARYLEKVALFRGKLKEIGCTINETPSYITSIFIGGDMNMKEVYYDFLEAGYLIPIFHYPLVKFDQPILRIILNDRHTEEQINRFIEVLAMLKERYQF